MIRDACLCLPLLAVFVAATPARAEGSCRLEPAKLRFEDKLDCPRGEEDHLALPGEAGGPSPDGEDEVTLRFGGEIRQRYEYTHNPTFGAAPQDKAGVWLQRYAMHADLDLGPNVRLFAQISSALEVGREGGPSPVDRNELALQNAFVDLHFPLGRDVRLNLRGGRQELQLGSGRLVDVREGPNVRRTFDALRASFDLPGWRVDALLARPIDAHPGVFDDRASEDRLLWGVYTSRNRPWLLPGSVELYYLGYEDESGTFARGTARENRHSIGARLSGALEGWDWNWEAIYQVGTFGEDKISAWSVASETGFTFRRTSWQPRVAISANIASGDSDPADGKLETLNPIFPRGNYFSQAAVLGPRNFYNLHPFVTVRPAQEWSLTADMNWFWRLEENDGVYSPAGQLLRAPSGSDERFVGSALSLSSQVELAENLTFTAVYSHFFPGDFLRATGPSEDIDFFELTLQAQF